MNIKIKELLIKVKELATLLKTRWKTESPVFFKKIYFLMYKLGGSALGILAMDKFADLQTLGVPHIIFTICGYVLTACAAIGLTAKLTIKNGNNPD